MEFAKCRSFLPPEVSARNFGEAGFGNLKFVIGQKNGGTMDSNHGGPSCPIYAKMDLQNGHVNFAEWSCGFWRMVMWAT